MQCISIPQLPFILDRYINWIIVNNFGKLDLNSTTTKSNCSIKYSYSWFLQARSIHDLAKKVFHILKTYPEKLESEFSEARKRTGRRSQVEVGKSHSCPKVATNMKHLGMKIGGSSKAMRSSLSGSLNTRKCLAKTGCSGTDTQEQKLLSGKK